MILSSLTQLTACTSRSSGSYELAWLTAVFPCFPAIASVVTDSSTASALPSLSQITAGGYLSSSFGSIGTSFTPSGLPPARDGSKSVAQRRAVAPPLAVTELRKVEQQEFEPYLAEVSALYERWQRETSLGRQGMADLSIGNGEGVGLGMSVRGGGREEELPSLDGVPKVFFEPEFNLANPKTFDIVTERAARSDQPSTAARDAAGSGTHNKSRPRGTSLSLTSKFDTTHKTDELDSLPGRSSLDLGQLATDQILHEKLEHYTAVIESHLVREIGLRSASFFSALSNLQHLHQQGEDCLGKIAELQAALDSDERGVGGAATRGLRILRTQARRRGLERVEEGVRVVQEVQEGVEGVRELVEAGEWLGALEVSEQIERLYYRGSSGTSAAVDEDPQPSPLSPPNLFLSDTSSKAPPTSNSKPTSPLNLTKVKALASVPSKLAALRAQVASALEAELTGVLAREMQEGVAEYVKADGQWKGKGREVDVEVETPRARARERAKERVRPGVRGLVRADGMERAVAAWRESVLRDVRALVREVSAIRSFGRASALVADSHSPLAALADIRFCNKRRRRGVRAARQPGHWPWEC